MLPGKAGKSKCNNKLHLRSVMYLMYLYFSPHHFSDILLPLGAHLVLIRAKPNSLPRILYQSLA